uniref:Ribonuclease T(2) n=1 Tax=Haemonchus contortus TaxID=6289 RepID=A0A7I5ECN9_HAECO
MGILNQAVQLAIMVGTIRTLSWPSANESRNANPPEKAVHRQIGSDFDYLMLTRIFPTAVCRADDDSVPDSCEIPTDTPEWSIHGLWPNFKNGSYPQFCDGSPRKFDSDLIKSIEGRLLRMWPNLYPAKTAHSFWKHEWEKHGTCSQNHKNLSSELLYFRTTMAIDTEYSVGSALERAGIIPRSEPYHLEDIRDGLMKELSHGMHVQLNCLTDKKTRQILLGDVRMCIDKSFQPIDCPRSNAFQPATYFTGHSAPLPSFKECPPLVTYLLETSTEPSHMLGLGHREFAYWINPLIPFYTGFFSQQKLKHELLWGITVPFMAVAIFIYVEGGRGG